jgi:hypothetical protein
LIVAQPSTGHQVFAPAGKANVLLFVSSDCPVSNSFAPEIQRVCSRFAGDGVTCVLVYEDAGIDERGVRAHMADYRYDSIAAAIDFDGAIARRAGASVIPQAIVVDANGAVRYRGRINNFYAALGKPRQQVTVHDLRDAVEALLAGRPITNPETEALGCFISVGKRR